LTQESKTRTDCQASRLFLDELFVFGRGLVLVVGGLVGEDDVQGDIEVADVDFAIELVGEDAGGEPDRAGMIREVFLAGGDQLLFGGWRRIFEFEEDVVGEHGLLGLRGGGDGRDQDRAQQREAEQSFHGFIQDIDGIRMPGMDGGCRAQTTGLHSQRLGWTRGGRRSVEGGVEL
jgi:hypothetical protein